MTYKESVTAAMTDLGRDPARLFVGYGLRYGKAGGTLAGVPDAQIVETPVAENLMAGLAIGMSLRGKKPVVYIERADFLTNALDAIVNHLDKAAQISRGEFKPAAILRIVVGNSTKPLFTGPTHTQDFSDALREMVGFAVWRVRSPEQFPLVYNHAAIEQEQGRSSAIFEYKDLL